MFFRRSRLQTLGGEGSRRQSLAPISLLWHGAYSSLALGLRTLLWQVFRSWDAHRSTPLLRGRRHILVLEFWQVGSSGSNLASQLARPTEGCEPASQPVRLWTSCLELER